MEFTNGDYAKLNCDIKIIDNRAVLTGDFSVPFVQEITSYPVQGANFSEAYRRGRWDGRKHLFNLKKSEIPAGLVAYVVKKLKEKYEDIKITVTDSRESAAPATAARGLDVEGRLKGMFGKDKFDYQMEAAEACLRYKRGILKIATNGGKSVISAAVTRHLCVPTLFVVPGKDLLYQILRSYADFLGLQEEDIGVIGDGHFNVGSWVTIAIDDSLYNKLESGDLDKYKNYWDLVWFDECHTTGSDTLYNAADKLTAYYRFGLSGTPLDRSDGATLRLIAQTGEVIYEVKNTLLVERGISVQPLVKFIRVDQPKVPSTRKGKKLTYMEVYNEAVVENPFLNSKIADCAINFLNEGKQCIIMVDKLLQGEIIDEMLFSISGKFLHGSLSSKERKESFQKFVEGEYRYLIGTSIMNQGIDMDCIDVLIFAGGGKAAIPTLQRAGRGLRSGNNRSEVVIVDVINTCHKWLIKHTQQRIETYKKEECFVMSMLDEESGSSRQR